MGKKFTDKASSNFCGCVAKQHKNTVIHLNLKHYTIIASYSVYFICNDLQISVFCFHLFYTMHRLYWNLGLITVWMIWYFYRILHYKKYLISTVKHGWDSEMENDMAPNQHKIVRFKYTAPFQLYIKIIVVLVNGKLYSLFFCQLCV